MITSNEIKIADHILLGGNNPLFLIGGPCVIENENHTLMVAEKIKSICEDVGITFIFKSSFDKANRSSIKSYRGPGLEKGLDILLKVKERLNIPVLSDVHEVDQVSIAAQVLDIIQIPAFLCRQTDLLLEAAKTQKPVNIKKGQFLSPAEMKNIIEKILSQNNEKIFLTERGTTFGYNNLVVDMQSIPIMKKLGFPVVIDASHSVQKPGGQGAFSGGEKEYIPVIASAGIASGADGVFIEIHDNPDKAPSDSYNSLKIKELRNLLSLLSEIHNIVSKSY